MPAQSILSLGQYKYADGTAGTSESVIEPDWISTADLSGPLSLTLIGQSIDDTETSAMFEIQGRTAGRNDAAVIGRFPRLGGQSLTSRTIPLLLPLTIQSYPDQIRVKLTLSVSSGSPTTNEWVQAGVLYEAGGGGNAMERREFGEITVTTSATAVFGPYPIGHIRLPRIAIANTGATALNAFTVYVASRQDWLDGSSDITSPETYTHADVTTLATLGANTEHSFALVDEGHEMIYCTATVAGGTTTVKPTLTGELR
tara:strand:- start:1453 stop:2223 length:771 start_codon:yes stop_codon:yes gene_type:complete